MRVSDLLRRLLPRLAPTSEATALADGFFGLPAALAGSLVLEIPMDRPGALPDISLGITTSLGRDILAGDAGHLSLSDQWSDALAAEVAWASRWKRDETLRTSLSALWLELDSGRLRPGPPDLVFARGRAFHRESISARDRLGWLFREYLDEVGHHVPEGREALFDLLDRMPTSVALSYLGAASGARRPELKICLEGLTSESLPGFLAEEIPSASKDALTKALALLSPHAEVLVLQLALTPAVGLRYGIEAYRRDQALGPLLDALLAGGLATTEQSEAVRDWRREPELLEDSGALAGFPKFLRAGRRPELHTAPSHIKLSIDGDRLSAKAYLWGALRWSHH